MWPVNKRENKGNKISIICAVVPSKEDDCMTGDQIV